MPTQWTTKKEPVITFRTKHNYIDDGDGVTDGTLIFL